MPSGDQVTCQSRAGELVTRRVGLSGSVLITKISPRTTSAISLPSGDAWLSLAFFVNDLSSTALVGESELAVTTISHGSPRGGVMT